MVIFFENYAIRVANQLLNLLLKYVIYANTKIKKLLTIIDF